MGTHRGAEAAEVVAIVGLVARGTKRDLAEQHHVRGAEDLVDRARVGEPPASDRCRRLPRQLPRPGLGLQLSCPSHPGLPHIEDQDRAQGSAQGCPNHLELDLYNWHRASAIFCQSHDALRLVTAGSDHFRHCLKNCRVCRRVSKVLDFFAEHW